MKSLDTINVWNLSCGLAIRTAKVLSSCDESEICKLTSRSAFSIATTVAASYKWDCENEFDNHLRSAKAGCAMLRTQLYIADELGSVSSDQSDKLIKESLDLSDRLQTIIASAHNSDFGEMLGKNSHRI